MVWRRRKKWYVKKLTCKLKPNKRQSIRNDSGIKELDVTRIIVVQNLISKEIKKLYEKIDALIELIWTSERMPVLQWYDPYRRRVTNCNVTITEESYYQMYVTKFWLNLCIDGWSLNQKKFQEFISIVLWRDDQLLIIYVTMYSWKILQIQLRFSLVAYRF
jgi:sulfatase maturation enzyme AslB (radical SAM superfamily)